MPGNGGWREPAHIYMKSRDAEEAKRCGHCDAEIEVTRWYPVATCTDPGGSFRLHQFCGDDCWSAWIDAD